MKISIIGRQFCVALALFGAAASAHAVDYCVGSTTQLRDALNDAEVDGADSVVKIRSGIYALSSDVRYEPAAEFTVPAGKLTVRGGYNSDCSSVSNDATATRFSGNAQVRFAFQTQTGSVSVAGIVFDGVHLTLTSVVLGACAGRQDFNLRRIGMEGAGVSITAQCHNALVENFMSVDAISVPGRPSPAGTALDIDLNDNEDGNIGDITILSSTISNGILNMDACCQSNANASIYNSVFTRAGTEIFSDDVNVLARFSRFDPITFSGGAVLLATSSDNTTAAADLDSEFRPNAGSAMLNSGTSNVPGGLATTDQTGRDRLIGPRPDRGARESSIDGTGVFVVTNTQANGTGSLSWALGQANSVSGLNRITFNIPGGCPRIINVASSLQVDDSVSFDGFTQPGTVINTEETTWNGVPCVILRGPGSGIGIEAADIGTGRIVVRGLAFERFALAISLPFGEDHSIEGSQFGGRIGTSGPILEGNDQAIALIGGGRSRIGGNAPSQRNLIGSSSDVGVWITTFLGLGGANNEITNNLIGIDKDLVGNLPNGTGVRINGSNNTVSGNRITGNIEDGVLISGSGAHRNVIVDNAIGGGTGAVSFTSGNGRMGVMVQNGAYRNEIGPNNIIGRNGDDGVRIFTDAGGRNKVFNNRIARNSALGIDIGPNGVDDIDLDGSFCDPETGCIANRRQNRPTISSAERRRFGIINLNAPNEVRGTLRSTVGGPYKIDVYAGDVCDANGFGEGERWIGSKTLTIPNEPYCVGAICLACENGNCTKDFTVSLPTFNAPLEDFITVTATSASGDTSEFSTCERLCNELPPDRIFANDFDRAGVCPR